MKKFLPYNLNFYNAIALGVMLSLSALPASADPGARVVALKQEIERNRINEVPLLRAALADPKALSAEDRLWALSRLGSALRKTLKYEDALRVLAQGQKEAAAIPIQRVYFTRQAIQVLDDVDRKTQALAEYASIAPLLPQLAGSSGELQGTLEAAQAWLAGGTVMSGLGQLPEAMELLIRALRVFDAQPGQSRGQTECMQQIAQVHFKSGNMEAALRDVQRAIDTAEEGKTVDVLAPLYMRKAHFLSSKGDVEAQYQALVHARKLALSEENAFNLAVIATNLSDVALQRKDYKATLRYVAEAIPLVEKSGDRESLLVCWINQGIAMNRLGQREGLDLIRKSIAEFTVTPGKKDIAAEVQGLLAEELASNGDYQQAYAAALDFKQRSDAVRKATDQKRIADSEARYQTDKKQRQIEVLEQAQKSQQRMQLLWALAGVLGLITTVILVISRVYLKRAYRKVEEMSLSDPLTGLRNRRYLASRIAGDLAQAGRQRAGAGAGANADVVFMMIDMDHFKSVNDVYGHAAGDAVLRQFSALLLEVLRDADTVVRWGGEEFLIVAKQASFAEIHLLAERVRAKVAGHGFDIGDGTVLHKTCSIGFACYPFGPPELPQPRWEDVVALADQCLYAAKSSGRDMWVGIVPGARAPAMPRTGDVRLGLEDGQVVLQSSPGRTVLWPAQAAEQDA